MGLKGLAHVGLDFGNKLLQFGDLADLLVGADLIFLVTIDGHTSRVIATVLESRQT